MPDGTDVVAEPPVGVAGRPVRSWRSIAVVSALVVVVAVAGSALGVAVSSAAPALGGHPSAPCGASEPKLTVQAVGQAMVTPDQLTVSVSVSASGPTATEALSSDNSKAAAAIAALRAGGVEARDIQTSGLSLQPQYVYPKGVPVLTGYQVTNSVTATLRDMARAGAIIDAIVGAAGNALQIQSLSFSAAHPIVAEDLARSRADAQAASHAKTLAESAGAALGPICSLTDQSQSPAPSPPGNGFATSASAGASVPIAAGTQTVSAQISVVYALRSQHVAPRVGRHSR
jgi:uncharacterized protein YggE